MNDHRFAARVRGGYAARGRGGFTLVELIATMLLVSVAAVAIGYSLSFALRHGSDGLWQAKSVALAESYIEEIMARRYDEVTPIGGVPPCAPATTPCSMIGVDGEIRSEFDDVDDYDGVDDAPPVDVNGFDRAEYAGYRVRVQVAYADAGLVGALGLDDATDAKIVMVTVSPPSGADMSFPVLRSNY